MSPFVKYVLMTYVNVITNTTTVKKERGHYFHSDVRIIEDKELGVLRENGLSRFMSSRSCGRDDSDGEIPGTSELEDD